MSKVKLVKAIYKNQVLCEEVELADNWYRRLMGLMFRKNMAIREVLKYLCFSLFSYALQALST